MRNSVIFAIFTISLLFSADAARLNRRFFPTLSTPVLHHANPPIGEDSSFVSITDLPNDESVVKEKTKVASLTSKSITSYAAFATVNKSDNANLFFWYFEPISGKNDAPVVIWLQGGPGCSSMTGLFAELGPFRMNEQTGKVEDNVFTWNQDYHLIFIDQPVGAGFSFVDNEKMIPTSEDEVADQLFEMISQFFTKFSSILKNDLYVFGESYAGKYVPAITYRIKHTKSGEMVFNLKGLGIGDGLTDPINQLPAYAEQAHGFGLIDRETQKHYETIQTDTINFIKQEKWANASAGFDAIWAAIESSSAINCYDVREHKGYDFKKLDAYLNTQSVKDLLHVGDHEFDDCYGPTMDALTLDMMKSIAPKVEYLLSKESGVKVLLYNGQWDFIVCQLGAENWISKLNWYGSPQWFATPKSVWRVKPDVFGGWVRQYESLTQIVVANSGHLVPMNQPEAALDMMSRFIENKGF